MEIREIFAVLDKWIDEQNAEAAKESMPAIKGCTFQIVGQTAIMEANLDIEVAATADVDALNDATYVVLAKFNEILNANALEYDQLSNEIWMPLETKYVDLFIGTWVKAVRAAPEYVMVSKAKMALSRNKELLSQYIASSPPDEFFKLCERYEINLDILFEESNDG